MGTKGKNGADDGFCWSYCKAKAIIVDCGAESEWNANVWLDDYLIGVSAKA